MSSGSARKGADPAGSGGGSSADLPRDPAGLCDRLGVVIPADLLGESLTHRSYAYEHGGLRPNERLEFLGDAVLGLVVTDALYRRNTALAEGDLAKMRSAVVSARALAEVARRIELGQYLLLGNGEESTGGRQKSSILADTMEAVLGAIYLGCGLEPVTGVIHDLIDPMMADAKVRGAGLDWKTSLQEETSRIGLGVPEYVVEGTGPDHARRFTARVRLSDGLHGDGSGATKKEAEQEAAQQTYLELTGASAGTAAPSGVGPLNQPAPDEQAPNPQAPNPQAPNPQAPNPQAPDEQDPGDEADG